MTHKEKMFQIDEKNIEKEFERLAQLLLLKKQLIINDAKFNFTEIEFYFYSKENHHEDAFTHKHEVCAGKWRFHNQGLDITLRGTNGSGGILIRGVEFNGKFTNGPRRIIFEVMKYLNEASKVENKFGIEDKKKETHIIFRTFRHGLNNPSSKKLKCNNLEFKEANYRFIVQSELFSGKNNSIVQERLVKVSKS